MSLLKNLFGKKEDKIKSNEDFWIWFRKNEKDFFNVVKTSGDFEKDFFDKLSPKLAELKDGYFFLTGMINNNTAELVLTADGNIKNIVFVEELVAAAPNIDGWTITALKSPLAIENVNISMGNYEFNRENLNFYYTVHPNLPDEIDLTIVHDDLNQQNANAITNGVYIFLDNYLGELNFATTIDRLNIVGKEQHEKELIPIEKLKDFLIWREKEFIEKYDGIIHSTENDSYNMLEAELENGNPLIAVVNTGLLSWEDKASHPWILNVEIRFSPDGNGLPNKDEYDQLNKLEDEILMLLKDTDGYLNIGRETANGTREIFFACKEFRKPSKIMPQFIKKYAGSFQISYEIYRDKYWQSFNRFMGN
ncbi:DUF695 domain-containing protein [Pedobacter sp. KBS0701]|uniref:DUF695 domain-containing protein n=1 Tax=Pedobacter sp. KBS0701 TaxID=2578106 RepID=UPI00110DFCE0|nr:DUF695 domain-containing protein [Pedobacter sp. KBS0701]QDW23818.1 DUF695 domain-containing protein [Pedobacter sp. KBS0701]